MYMYIRVTFIFQLIFVLLYICVVVLLTKFLKTYTLIILNCFFGTIFFLKPTYSRTFNINMIQFGLTRTLTCSLLHPSPVPHGSKGYGTPISINPLSYPEHLRTVNQFTNYIHVSIRHTAVSIITDSYSVLQKVWDNLEKRQNFVYVI